MKRINLIAMAALSMPMFGQVVLETQENGGTIRTSRFYVGEAGIAMAPQQATVQFMAGRSAPASDVKGAPYSAEGITEFVQTLGDGTRITRKNTTKMARDSEGRTRTENGGAIAGPIGGEIPLNITITDPVAKEIIYLREAEKSATRMPLRSIFTVAAPPPPPPPPPPPSSGATTTTAPTGDVIFQRAIPMPAPGSANAVGGGVRVYSSNVANQGQIIHTEAISVLPGGKDAVTESLGKQIIAGVSCDATRVTNSIPAGQIGNDREIRVFTETCVSPELKITMLSRTVDPMNGETIFRIASISRAEPPKSLFQVPAGYTVDENFYRNAVPALAPAPPTAPAPRRK